MSNQPAYATLTEAFKNKVATLIEKSNRAGLEKLVRDLEARKFTAEMRFNKSRSVKNGDAYGKLRFEYSHAKSCLNGMRTGA